MRKGTLCPPDVNECAKDNGGCHAQRKCINSAGSMKCADCATGWANDGAKSCKGLCLLLIVLSSQNGVVVVSSIRYKTCVQLERAVILFSEAHA